MTNYPVVRHLGNDEGVFGKRVNDTRPIELAEDVLVACRFFGDVNTAIVIFDTLAHGRRRKIRYEIGRVEVVERHLLPVHSKCIAYWLCSRSVTPSPLLGR